jgi:hypothetical protein
LAGLLALPVIWWLLRFTPPKPTAVQFPPTRLLKDLEDSEQTPEHSPWWLTALRICLAALIILSLARPVLDPDREGLAGDGPLVLVVDNGWAAASHWQDRQDLIATLIGRAQREKRAVLLAPTAPGAELPLKILDGDQASETAAAVRPAPYDPDRAALAQSLAKSLEESTAPSIVWLSDGLDYGGAQGFAEALQKLAGNEGGFSVAQIAESQTPLGLSASLGQSGTLTAKIIRPGGSARGGSVYALSARGERLGEAEFELGAGAAQTTAPIVLPLEIRNQVARLQIAGVRSAGAVYLLDARSQWRRVGVISGESRELAQPLLSPLYYVERALSPYSEIVSTRDRNVAIAVENTLERNISVLVLADIGKLVGSALEDIDDWVERGGTLVRFAGNRLERGGDTLLPQGLRQGGRALGGSLSWSSPQPLGEFEENSPFFGLQPAEDIVVRRQVLTDPARGARAEVWARLKDGTPLVSAARRGEGWLVLFHVTANSDWSNLPMSGLFVEMLRRIVERSVVTSVGGDAKPAASAPDTAAPGQDGPLEPQQVLDGFGQLTSPSASVVPLKLSQIDRVEPGPDHPPGYYGPSGAMRALNAVDAKTVMRPLAATTPGLQTIGYGQQRSIPLKPWTLAAAFILLLIDTIAVLALSSQLTFARQLRRPAAALVIFALALAIGASSLLAQERLAADEKFALEAALKTRLAYVVTGNDEIDRVSRSGLIGLGKVLGARTAVEAAEPIGVDVARDELAFFPLLYWPVDPEATGLSSETLAKIDAFMKQGGIVLFDTRDYPLSSSLPGRADQSPGSKALTRLIGKLDVPALEPVHNNHVLTKSFYLLRGFPGRWDGGQLWAEAEPDEPAERLSRSRRSDGVSSILITSNDLAAAWALDDRNRPMFPVVPGGEVQREMAFRTGINIVMYALTGNYKADQVHLPALLERLGQ